MAFNVSRILLAAFGAAASLHAAAQEVVPLGARVTSNISVQSDPHLLQKQSSDLSTDISVAGFGGVATAIVNPGVPAVSASSASALDGTSDYADAIATAGLYYYYTVKDATGPVPIDFDYDIKITTTNNSFAQALLSVTNNYPYYAEAIGLGVESDEFPVSGTHELVGTATANAYEGQVDQVLMYTYVETMPGYSSQSSTAFVDPRIYIDPAYLAANPGVSLEFSAGVGNLGPAGVTSVPEPANAALLFAGLSLFAALRRRRA